VAPPTALLPPVDDLPAVDDAPAFEVLPPTDVEPAVPVSAGLLSLPQAQTQDAAPNNRTNEPTLFLNMQSLAGTARLLEPRAGRKGLFKLISASWTGISKLAGIDGLCLCHFPRNSGLKNRWQGP
jgi:hypothetical protein